MLLFSLCCVHHISLSVWINIIYIHTVVIFVFLLFVLSFSPSGCLSPSICFSVFCWHQHPLLSLLTWWSLWQRSFTAARSLTADSLLSAATDVIFYTKTCWLLIMNPKFWVNWRVSFQNKLFLLVLSLKESNFKSLSIVKHHPL